MEADDLYAAAARALSADGEPRDLAKARDLFRRAGEAGRCDAAVIHANFVASGVGAAPNWKGGVALLRQLVSTNPRSRRELAMIEAMTLNDQGDPVQVPISETLSEAPHIRLFRSLFTNSECAFVMEAARPMLAPSVVTEAATGRQIRNPVRTSDGTGFPWPLENPAIHALNRRIAAASGTDSAQGEPLQILRYRAGEQFRLHHDAFSDVANQRVLTMIVWLNDDYEGGETEFPTPGLALKGKRGDALLFRNIGADGRPDPAAAHAGRPVLRGEKWIASRWIRARPLEVSAGHSA